MAGRLPRGARLGGAPLLLLVLVLAACGALGQPAPFSDGARAPAAAGPTVTSLSPATGPTLPVPTLAPLPTATPRPAEPSAPPLPSRTPATPRPLARSLQCADLPSQAAAQDLLRSNPLDPYGLDPDGNGIACENNPAPFDRVPVPRR